MNRLNHYMLTMKYQELINIEHISIKGIHKRVIALIWSTFSLNQMTSWIKCYWCFEFILTHAVLYIKWQMGFISEWQVIYIVLLVLVALEGIVGLASSCISCCIPQCCAPLADQVSSPTYCKVGNLFLLFLLKLLPGEMQWMPY